jgi:aminopeptidase YwaD
MVPLSMGLRRSLVLISLAACAQPGRTDEGAAPVPTKHAAVAVAPVPVLAPAPAPARTPPPGARCIEALTPYDLDVMRERVTLLAAPELDGRVPGAPGDVRARAFNAERFACHGLVPAGPGGAFEQPFTDAGDATANVLGYVKGADEGGDIIVVGAHHDHLGGGLLGANDNASGVVALLAIAQAVQQRETPPKRTIVFATWGAEERGMRGSYHYVAHAPEALPMARVVQVINLDMIGSHASRGFVAAMGTFRGLGATSVLARLDDSYPRLNVGLGGVARGSDHEPFCKLGIPYVFFWTPDKNCYHRKCDTAAKVDFPRMLDIAALAGDLTTALADSDTDLAELRRRRGCGR